MENNEKRIIPINESLLNYIERLIYEAFRYEDLLKSVNRNATSFTDEEWEDSLKYFKNKCKEAQLSKQFALEYIRDTYKDIIQDNAFIIDFNYRCICIGGNFNLAGIIGKNNLRDKAGYGDQLSRLYLHDDENKEYIMTINGRNTKDITIQVTDDCNMRCTYCYQHCKGKHSTSFETAKEFIDLILNSDDKVNSYIDSNKAIGAILDFIGGEPLMEIDLISKVTDYFIAELFRRKHPWAIKFMISMTSNGLLYFEPKCQEYIRKHINHLSYSVTIDGDKTVHDSCRLDIDGNGTYDRAIAAALDYKELSGIGYSTKVTLSPDNVAYCYDAVKSLIENGYDEIHMNCVFEEGWNYNHATILYNRLKAITDYLEENNLFNKVDISMFSSVNGHPLDPSDNRNWCGGTGLMIAMDYKGDIYPCLRYMESSIGDRQEPYIIGNLKDGICKKDIHCNRVECMKNITRRSQSTDECFNCPIASGCAWCSAYNYEMTGTPDKRVTFICPMHKATVLANKYYFNKRKLDYSLDIPKEWALEIITEDEYNMLLGDGD